MQYHWLGLAPGVNNSLGPTCGMVWVQASVAWMVLPFNSAMMAASRRWRTARVRPKVEESFDPVEDDGYGICEAPVEPGAPVGEELLAAKQDLAELQEPVELAALNVIALFV